MNIGYAKQREKDLYNDDAIHQETLNAIAGVTDRIINKFKTTEEAMAWVDEGVIPDLEIDGIPADQIARVRNHLASLAGEKPYQTVAELEAGAKVKPRGRPKKPKD